MPPYSQKKKQKGAENNIKNKNDENQKERDGMKQKRNELKRKKTEKEKKKTQNSQTVIGRRCLRKYYI